MSLFRKCFFYECLINENIDLLIFIGHIRYSNYVHFIFVL